MYKKLTITIIVFLLLVSIGFAAPQGSQVSVGNTSRGVGSTSQTADASAGNVTLTNVTTVAITTRWAGFYGHVSGTVRLADASNNIFYQWTLANVSGVAVYASNGTITNWTAGNIVPTNESVLPGYLRTDSADNFTLTFANLTTYNSSSLNIANVSYTNTWSGGAPGPLSTYALYSQVDGVMLFSTIALDDTTAFDNSVVDYQVLVPTNTTTSYNFYLELP